MADPSGSVCRASSASGTRTQELAIAAHPLKPGVVKDDRHVVRRQAHVQLNADASPCAAAKAASEFSGTPPPHSPRWA